MSHHFSDDEVLPALIEIYERTGGLVRRMTEEEYDHWAAIERVIWLRHIPSSHRIKERLMSMAWAWLCVESQLERLSSEEAHRRLLKEFDLEDPAGV